MQYYFPVCGGKGVLEIYSHTSVPDCDLIGG